MDVVTFLFSERGNDAQKLGMSSILCTVFGMDRNLFTVSVMSLNADFSKFPFGVFLLYQDYSL
jgi:hypothetical protein